MEPGWQSGVLTLYRALLPSHQTHTSPPQGPACAEENKDTVAQPGGLV